jgi:hypothetical protein
MTRRSRLALVTLLAGLLSLASVGTVSADSPCTGYAQEHCEAMAATNDAARFHTAVAPIPVHLLSASGVGQEHFEAMMTTQFSVFSVGAPGSVTAHLPGYAPEHFEEIMSK